MIRSLNPIPSRGFASAERSVYLVPEATVFCRDGEVIIEMERGSQPKVELNQYYCSLLQSTEDTPETKDYLRRMMAEANELMSGLQSREKTLRQIMGAIVKGQRDFFLKGGALAPLTMQQVAEELGLPFTLKELRNYELLKWGRQHQDREMTDDEMAADDETTYWLLDRGWSNDESAFCGGEH